VKVKWIKRGLIFDPKTNDSGWIRSYASLPTADLASRDLLRIHFSTRDEKGRSRPTYIEVDPENPKAIKYVHDGPTLRLGEMGTFDDNGIMPSWVVDFNGLKYLYYIGWNPQVTVSYRLAIGLALSMDGGRHFEKVSPGPILDRAIDEPFFNTAPCVLYDGISWRMWYVSCTGWKVVNDWPEPAYNVKYAVSSNGIDWKRTGITCIDYDEFAEAVGRPCVYRENGIFKMIYSYRSATDYRTDRLKSYRLGYAESKDGTIWERLDDRIGIHMSEDGWDSRMIEYGSTYVTHGKRRLIYNGNGFGESGFGYAEASDTKSSE
jgi:hypothetical protein